MKVAVIPDAAMIIIPLIEKNGHEYISPTNFSKLLLDEIAISTHEIKIKVYTFIF